MITPGGYPRSVRQVKGLRIEMIDLNRLIRDVKGVSLEGLIRSAIIIRDDTEKTSPVTPVDLGNLRASWFVVSAKGTAPDPTGYSGKFRNNPAIKKTAGQFKAERSALIAAAQTKVVTYKDPVVIMGYSANYAMWVHEMIDADFTSIRKRWRRPGHYQKYTPRAGAGAKWFEAAIKRNKNVIVETVAKYAIIP